VQIEGLDRAARREVVDHPVDDRRRIVPVVERAGAGQQVDVAPSVDVPEVVTTRPFEHHREIPAVTPNVRLVAVEHGLVHHSVTPWISTESIREIV
jgi:hypothetical protein